MSTILSVSVPRQYLEPRFTDADWTLVHRQAFSIDGYSPVRVTVYIAAGSHIAKPYALVKVTCVPDGGTAHWREPSAKQRRDLLDHLLSTRRLIRCGPVQPEGTGWTYRYNLRHTA